MGSGFRPRGRDGSLAPAGGRGAVSKLGQGRGREGEGGAALVPRAEASRGLAIGLRRGSVAVRTSRLSHGGGGSIYQACCDSWSALRLLDPALEVGTGRRPGRTKGETVFPQT